MDTEAEIHAINNKLTEIVGAIDSIKEKRTDDKEDIKELYKMFNKLLVSMNQLNLTLEYNNGQIDGASKAVKIFKGLSAALVFITIVSITATTIDLYARVSVLEGK